MLLQMEPSKNWLVHARSTNDEMRYNTSKVDWWYFWTKDSYNGRPRDS
jgi:hypothetical protein